MVEVVAEPSEVQRDAFSEIPAAATANATASSDHWALDGTHSRCAVAVSGIMLAALSHSGTT